MLHLKFLVTSKEKPVRLRKKTRYLKPIRPSRVSEAAYRDVLRKIIFRLVNVVNEELKPFLLNQPEVVQDKVYDSSTGDEIRRRIKSIMSRFHANDLNSVIVADRIVRGIKANVDERLAAEIRKSISIDIYPAIKNDNRLNSYVEDAVKENVALIKTIPDQYFQKLEKHVIEAFERGDRHEKLADSLKRVALITDNRARIIARDQVSKITGIFNKVRQTSIGIDEYIWSTSQDERVRETHADNEGKRFKWNDPPSETGHPGEDIMCRCVAIPYFNLDEMEKELGL